MIPILSRPYNPTNVGITGGTISGITLHGWAPQFVATDNVALVSGGTGHAVGDVLTLPHGVTLSVSSVSVGVITGWTVISRGSATSVPAGAQAQVSTTGTGVGASFTLTWVPNARTTVGSLASNSGNLFIGGEQLLQGAFSGTESVFLGDRAGGNITGGSFIIAIGHNAAGIGAAVPLPSASSLICIGTDAGRNIGTGANNSLIIGSSAAQGLNTNLCAVVGNSAGGALTTGTQNTFMGHASGGAITTGAGNVFVGYNSTATAANVNGSVIIGGADNGGGVGARGGTTSVVIGARAGNASLTGANNTIIGRLVASTTLTTGTGNILLGVSANCDTALAADSNTLRIQGNGTTAAILGTALNATPVILFPGANITIGAAGLPTVTSGAGAPVTTQPAGSIYLRTDGAAGTRIYVNQSGSTTWAAIAGV